MTTIQMIESGKAKTCLPGISIAVSREHVNEVDTIKDFFPEVPVDANYARLSEASLPMQIIIFLAGSVASGAVYDLLKEGVIRFYKQYQNAHISLRPKNEVMFSIDKENHVHAVCLPEKQKEYEHIKNIDDLIEYLKTKSTKWEEITLGECIEDIAMGPFGSNLKVDMFTESGVPIIKGGNLFGLYVNGEFTFVSEEKAKSLGRSVAYPGDFIITHRGTLGQIALVPELPYLKYVTSQSQLRFKVHKDKINNRFLLYFLKSKKGQYELLKNASQVGVPAIATPTKSIKEINLYLPPLPEQQAIASLLSSFDDKIELLREENTTLETLGQTIFQEWFGKYSVDDELPDGWRVGKLGEVIENFDSQRIPIASDKREKGKYPYYGATGINDYVKDYIFDGIYTLLGEDGSVMKENGRPFTQYVWGKVWVNNHAHVLQGKNGFSTEMIKIILDNTDIAPFVNGAVQLKINQSNMNAIPVIMPDQETLKQFDEAIQPIFTKIRDNSEQIQSLSASRDALLPKLMSGEVRVEF